MIVYQFLELLTLLTKKKNLFQTCVGWDENRRVTSGCKLLQLYVTVITLAWMLVRWLLPFSVVFFGITLTFVVVISTRAHSRLGIKDMFSFVTVPKGSPSHGGDVMVYIKDINQPSLPTLFYSVLASISVFMAFQLYFIP